MDVTDSAPPVGAGLLEPSELFKGFRVLQAAGLEFTPNPAATLERARTQLRTPFLRLVKFSDDDLDMVRYPLQTPSRPPLVGGGYRPYSYTTEVVKAARNPIISNRDSFSLLDRALLHHLRLRVPEDRNRSIERRQSQFDIWWRCFYCFCRTATARWPWAHRRGCVAAVTTACAHDSGAPAT
eukprot:1620970-Pyramimonas_sp.AAC.1